MCPDDETRELMEEYDLDKDDAERLKDLMDELGLDADDAYEILDEV